MLGSLPVKEYSFCAFSELENRLLNCAAKKRLPENAKTVICFLFPYKVENVPPENISRYAAVPDYHTVCGGYLRTACEKLKAAFPDNKFEPFADNSPIPEVYAASLSGLGLAGDNGLLITRKYGTFAFLGEIVTDLLLPCYSEYMECTHCGRCKTACPVALNKGECISALTQKKGTLSDAEKQIIKEHKTVWGCDICANACPFNKYSQFTYIKEFISGYRNKFCEDENPDGRAYLWRGIETIKRNLCIV